MKFHQIAFTLAILGGASFAYEVHNLGKLEEEGAVLKARIEHHQSLGANAGAFVRSFFDGLTLGSFAEEGIFTESKRFDRLETQLRAEVASFISRYDTAIYYRKWGLILAICGAALGYFTRDPVSAFGNEKIPAPPSDAKDYKLEGD